MWAIDRQVEHQAEPPVEQQQPAGDQHEGQHQPGDPVEGDEETGHSTAPSGRKRWVRTDTRTSAPSSRAVTASSTADATWSGCSADGAEA